MIFSICFIICLKSVNILSPRSSHSSFAQSLHFHPCSPSPWRGDIWWDQEWTCDATLQIYFKTVEDNSIQGQAYLKWDHHIQWAFSSQWNRVPPKHMFTLILGVELQLAMPVLGSWMHICSSSWVDTLDTGQPTQKNSPLNVPKTGVIRGQHLHWPLLSRILQKRAAEKWALEQPSTCQEC